MSSDLPGGESADLAGKVLRPNEEAERRALIWLMDVRTHGGPIDRRYAASMIETLAWFEANHAALLARLAEAGKERSTFYANWQSCDEAYSELERAEATLRNVRDVVQDENERLHERAEAVEAERDRWLEWSAGRYPDNSPGDVIAAETDGTIVLDDGITTWNPLRALAFFGAERDPHV